MSTINNEITGCCIDSINTATIEDVKSYWDKRPCNINHSNKEIGTKDYFDDVAERKYKVEPHILKFAAFEKYKNKKVLEVGCGIGTAAVSFIENGACYTGLDISETSINIAKTRLGVYDLPGQLLVENIENYTVDGPSGPLRDDSKPSSYGGESFDLVYSFGVLHHTPDIRKSIKNIHSLLKEGGEFKLMLYAKNSLKMFKIKDGLDQYEAQSNVPIANTYTNEDIYELLKEFKNIDIVQTHIFPYKIDSYKNYKYIKEDYFESMPSSLFNCLEKNLGWHLCITCLK